MRQNEIFSNRLIILVTYFAIQNLMMESNPPLTVQTFWSYNKLSLTLLDLTYDYAIELIDYFQVTLQLQLDNKDKKNATQHI